jgi:hypothetical protein
MPQIGARLAEADRTVDLVNIDLHSEDWIWAFLDCILRGSQKA